MQLGGSSCAVRGVIVCKPIFEPYSHKGLGHVIFSNTINAIKGSGWTIYTASPFIYSKYVQ